MYVLGIETSCDETAVSVVKNGTEVLSNIILSQTDIHKYFGGVIPELACRRHLEVLDGIAKDALEEAHLTPKDIGLVAVTNGPGLAGALLIGVSYAKGLAYSLNIPVIGINHIEGHLYVNFMEHKKLNTPCIGLVISGGHTTLVHIKDTGVYEVLGQTQDDAAGEAFDKVAKLLGLSYPGGPVIDRLSAKGNPAAVKFPRAMIKQDNYNFSFSGLKTAVVYYVKGYGKYKKKKDTANIHDICASFQEALIEQLLNKTISAVSKTGVKTVILGGGVSRNSRLRKVFKEELGKRSIKIYIPPPILCTDNAVMTAGLGWLRYNMNGPSGRDLDADTNLGLK